MRENIEKLAKYVVSDIEELRNNSSKSERLGIEIMALNALCNAERALTEECQSK